MANYELVWWVVDDQKNIKALGRVLLCIVSMLHNQFCFFAFMDLPSKVGRTHFSPRAGHITLLAGRPAVLYQKENAGEDWTWFSCRYVLVSSPCLVRSLAQLRLAVMPLSWICFLWLWSLAGLACQQCHPPNNVMGTHWGWACHIHHYTESCTRG